MEFEIKNLRDGLHQKYLTNITEKTASDDVLETVGKEITWSRICEQVNHLRRNASPPKRFFSQLREHLQTNNQSRLKKLSRKLAYNLYVLAQEIIITFYTTKPP